MLTDRRARFWLSAVCVLVVSAHQVNGSFSCVSDESVAEVQCSEFSTETA